jgi:hypothetical protein
LAFLSRAKLPWPPWGPVLAVSLVLALGALALGGGRLVDAVRRWRDPPPPATIIIVAPVDAQTV